MAELRFGVLGPLEVFRDDEPVPVPTGRRRAVLACLLVHAGRPVPAETLVEAGWGDDLPKDPRPALNTVLSRLRSVLGAEAVRSDATGILLDVSAAALDAGRFEALRRQAESAPPEEAGALLQAALDLWRGPAYAEFVDRDFAILDAQRLERLRLDTVEARGQAALDTGHPEAAVEPLQTMLAEHPFRDHAVALLLTSLYRAGRQADALARYRHHRALLADELGLDPSPELRDLEARILGHRLPPSPTAPPAEPRDGATRLDVSTSFVGREVALVDLVDAVCRDRVVTVTGVGGVGKTRLVAQVLPGLGERLRVPITVVELASIRPGRVAAAVADALGLRARPETVTGEVIEYLTVTRTVLVLDNCEHLVEDVSALVEVVRRRCPLVRVVATSRRRLGVGAERVLPLEPFGPPVAGAAPARVGASPAVRLFTDRVRRLRPSFGLSDDNAAVIAEVCRRLDGLPLALELAASRAATLGVGPVLERLDADVIGAGSGGLGAVVEWSYRLLTAEQRRLLARLSVFSGRFDVAAVHGLTSHLDTAYDVDAASEALTELAESSLLASYDASGVLTYRMLAIVQAYAAQRLAESGDSDAAQLAHARWVRDLAQRAQQDWTGGAAASAAARLERGAAELVTAVRRALAAGQVELAAAITGPLMMCLHWAPGPELSQLMTDVAERGADVPAPELAPGVAAGAFAAVERGELERGRRLARAAREMADAPDEPVLAWLALGVAAMYAGDHDQSAAWFGRMTAGRRLPAGHRVEGHSALALLACYRDDLPAAEEHASIAVAAAGAAGAEASHAFARYAAGEVAARTDPDRGASLLAEAAAEADRVGASQVSQVARLALLAVLVRRDRHHEAVELAAPLLQDLRRAGLWPHLWTTLRIVAELLGAVGSRHDAALLLGAAAAAPTAPPLMGEDIGRYARLSSELRAHVGESVVRRIDDLAAGLPRAQVVDRAVVLLGDLAAADGTDARIVEDYLERRLRGWFLPIRSLPRL